MSDAEMGALTTERLVELYVELSKRQGELTLNEFYDDAEYRPVFDRLGAVEKELRSRGADALRALLPLLDYPTMSWWHLTEAAQVRLNAARDLLKLEPERALATLRDLAEHGPDGTQRAEARMTLRPIA